MKDFNTDDTRTFFAKAFWNAKINHSPYQISDMIDAVDGFCRCFKNTENELKVLNDIYFDPINFVIKEYGEHIPDRTKQRISFKKSLSKLEWMYFKDSLFRTHLNKTYTFDIQHPRFNKNLFFEDIVEVRSCIRKYLVKVFVNVAMREGFSLNFDIGAYSGKIVQVGGGVEDGFSEVRE